MTDTRNPANQDKPKAADTTGSAGQTNADKTEKPGDKSNPPADAAGQALLDNSYADYQRLMQARNAAGTDKDGHPADAGANADLKKKGLLADLTVTHHDAGNKPSDGAAARPETVASGDGRVDDPAKLQRLAYMQTTLQNFLPLVMAPEKGPADAALQKSIAGKQNAIKQETDRGEFGPATRAAYSQYVDWLEKSALPEHVRDLKRLQLPLDEPGANGAKVPPLDLKIDRSQIPDDAQLRRLDDAVKWTQSADARLETAQRDLLKRFDQESTQTVNNLNLPRGWITDIGKDPNRWRTSVAPMLNGALTIKSNLEILDELNKGGGNHPIESALPPGTQVDRDKNGKIKAVHLDLPQTWDMSKQADKAKADRLQELLASTNALVAPAVPQLRTLTNRPELALNWGDTELSGMKGRFDGGGNFLGLVKKDARAKPGEHLEDVNLLESRFNIEEKNGKIVVHQHVQAQDVPWWGYQNLIGVKDIGKGIDITHTYNPDDSVVIRTSSGMEVKQAKDLSTYRNIQMVKHYGEIGLMGALDLGMCVTGTIELGAAVKAARLAEVGVVGLDILGRGAAKNVLLSEGTEVTGRMIAKQAVQGTVRATVGFTGVLNNAGARESNAGMYVNYARSAYFVGDGMYGLGKFGVGATKSLLGTAPEAGLGAGKVTLAGLTGGSKVESIYKGSHQVFRASEYGFIPMIGYDLTGAVRKTINDKDPHVEKARKLVANDRPDAGDK